MGISMGTKGERAMRDRPNFQGDWFVHAIDIQGPHDEKPQKVGGIDNAGAAQAAFKYLVSSEPPDRIITLRDGARVMDRQNGRAVWEPTISRWVEASAERNDP
ncbi:hypothetical protein B7L88_gp116 [Rhizobium phage RHEph10]|uniref:hypothetical protein n=1 Tax=Rhizobium phage RHEph10 TaxID=1220717 RepID=UPI0002AB03E9|nr:hypothetical protein B7L88_gp116 [Rhizobium phage RHEph10]AGC36172.1 hypothetical protein RHEph10_gp129 [Rhizobium phage RHEph10]